ncbi:NADPH-dependent 7-cyano-7-deazaguanine reductase QueF [Polynucleobacter sphagniphilus]|jgi:7-cyano-7-deazaguanine reductase|uniref:NADPH-dependent 7-cyano-7-deazaguanine reductase n=1 Tax=Polynucleobacter sphagniphilus TaxID=1743169 RepID=A0AA43M7W5_9BURK|nr:NADPH-dependent 7-cyano-7-deazaguanine reductase QueF [Polynucleobacter sphagniphilus]MDF9788594.1 7-cyano-7-deazaguanine reductase [Polynucleobacter sphagniphilus]MDH6155173.1 7-cyano-7-deazaguanine reductase [Polynucleobacter sphagniphilus]MDH6241761.1 7-cyano-7-deazaguanine reductase [Polynucleobacter sphagniphilus]MDH6248806.1 7-cyano-7-deazaguanine reductase [Polynucleobacter sphagniphilus]MDH6299685.1 7-cyano-7-deazaguanine reductase [Polynucleobacter sphagniphilus]
MATLPLGQASQYPDQYDPSLLFPIPRSENRAKLGIEANQVLPFVGVDIWNAYELSWLNQRGKPQIALAEFQVPADSPNMIESKSFKLYLNSLNSARFENEDAVRERIITDLSAVAGSKVSTRIYPTDVVAKKGMQEMTGVLIDRLDIEVDPNLSADPGLLGVNDSFGPIEQCLVSHLLKSNCPVTGQPDWASVQIRYQGRPILEEGLLRYLIGFRQLGEFHEHCVETIFSDIKRQCKPEKLSVYARYTRRGGLDINPFRTDHNAPWPDNTRHARQ